MANDLRGGVAVVTGGAGTSAGLGQALVSGFAARGMRVAILDVDVDAAAALAETLRSAGAEAIAAAVDVTDPASVHRAADDVKRAFGGCNVVCAHVGGGGQGRFVDFSLDDWRAAMELMVLGTITTVDAFLPLLRETGGLRRIVLTSSVAALAPGRLQGPYRAAKAAVTSIGETLDLELGDEGIGTTVAFPAGMVPEELLELVRAAVAAPPASGEDRFLTIAREMTPDPLDVTTGDVAAAAVIDAVEAGRRYVVTHGVSAAVEARGRQRLLDDAFSEASRRRA